jgi:hypothetical protein
MKARSIHSCEYCSKTYTRKTAYTRHYIVCEILHQTKREKKCREEETTDLPSYQQLVAIVQELAVKCQTMEEKMNDMQKWANKTKQKLNILQWLNANIESSTFIEEWSKTHIQVTEEDNQMLLEETFIHTMQHIFRKTIEKAEAQIPIFCFSQKQNQFYCFSQEASTWTHFEMSDFILMLKRIHQKMVRALCDWQTKNTDKINQSDKMQLLYNKTLLKLMNVNFGHDSPVVSKIKNDLFQFIKKDMKTIIEYEYEF